MVNVGSRNQNSSSFVLSTIDLQRRTRCSIIFIVLNTWTNKDICSETSDDLMFLVWWRLPRILCIFHEKNYFTRYTFKIMTTCFEPPFHGFSSFDFNSKQPITYQTFKENLFTNYLENIFFHQRKIILPK